MVEQSEDFHFQGFLASIISASRRVLKRHYQFKISSLESWKFYKIFIKNLWSSYDHSSHDFVYFKATYPVVANIGFSGIASDRILFFCGFWSHQFTSSNVKTTYLFICMMHGAMHLYVTAWQNPCISSITSQWFWLLAYMLVICVISKIKVAWILFDEELQSLFSFKWD